MSALMQLLDGEAVLRIDAGPDRPRQSLIRQGATTVAEQTVRGLASVLAQPEVVLESRLVNGAPGVVATVRGQAVSIIGFVIADGRIAAIDALADPARVHSILSITPTDK